MLEPALFGGFQIPVDMRQRQREHFPVQIEKLGFALFKSCYLQIVDVIHVARIFQKRGNVRGKKALSARKPHYHGTILSYCVNFVGVIAEQYGKRI